MNRALSGYAFNQYGNDAKLYNGIHDLETKLESADEELKKRDAEIVQLELDLKASYEYWSTHIRVAVPDSKACTTVIEVEKYTAEWEQAVAERDARIAECLRRMRRYTEDDGWAVHSQSVAQEAIDACQRCRDWVQAMSEVQDSLAREYFDQGYEDCTDGQRGLIDYAVADKERWRQQMAKLPKLVQMEEARLAELEATERRYQALVENGLYVRKWTWVSGYSVHYQDGREIGHGQTTEEAIDAALEKLDGK